MDRHRQDDAAAGLSPARHTVRARFCQEASISSYTRAAERMDWRRSATGEPAKAAERIASETDPIKP
jgi:hypothetical protein